MTRSPKARVALTSIRNDGFNSGAPPVRSTTSRSGEDFNREVSHFILAGPDRHVGSRAVVARWPDQPPESIRRVLENQELADASDMPRVAAVRGPGVDTNSVQNELEVLSDPEGSKPKNLDF